MIALHTLQRESTYEENVKNKCGGAQASAMLAKLFFPYSKRLHFLLVF